MIIMNFQIKHTEFVNKTFRFPKELADRLAFASNETNVSMNEFTIQALEFALEHLNTQNEEGASSHD